MTREARRRRLYLALAGLLVYVRESGSGDYSRNVRLWIHGRKIGKQRNSPEKETSAFTIPRDLGIVIELQQPLQQK